MAKILIVEDDQALVTMVSDYLKAQLNVVETISDGADAVSQVRNYPYDLIILDWDLPNLSGIEILKQIRALGNTTPVLMLTGKSEIDEKEMGLDLGADDYLTKPFNMRELAARLRTLIRRSSGQIDNTLRTGGLVLDPARYQVTIDGDELELTRKEFQLLEFLMRHPNEVFSAEDLLDRLWSSETDSFLDAVRQSVSRLRKKLKDKGKGPTVKNVYGLGYKLEI